MLAKIHTYGPWQLPYKVTEALCSDGVRRTAWITAEPDTFFSIPARVKVKGKTVSGYVTGMVTDGQYDYEFHVVQTAKNYHLLPNT